MGVRTWRLGCVVVQETFENGAVANVTAYLGNTELDRVPYPVLSRADMDYDDEQEYYSSST